MRKLLSAFTAAGLAAGLATSAAAAPATGATRSVADYLCSFAGKCGDEQPAIEETQAAPETRGFSLARPTAAAPAAAVRPRTTMPRVANARAQRAAQSARGQRGRNHVTARPAYPSIATAPVTPEYSYAGAPPNLIVSRIDLRLSFKRNSAEMTDQARQEAAVFAQSMQAAELRSKRFVIEGHTDSAGDRAFNRDLSERRARSVAMFLASQGVDSNRLRVRGMGSDAPRAGQDASSPNNRRVEAVIQS